MPNVDLRTFAYGVALACCSAGFGTGCGGADDAGAAKGDGGSFGTGWWDSGAGSGGGAPGPVSTAFPATSGQGGTAATGPFPPPAPPGGTSGAPYDLGAPPMPEDETYADFRLPRASGRFVYTASAQTHSLAIIDSYDLHIEVLPVAPRPSIVASIAPPRRGEGDKGDESGAVAVLHTAAAEVSLVRTDEQRRSWLKSVPVSPGANELVVTGDGLFVVAYHDVDGPEVPGLASDQELAIIDTVQETSQILSVGAHPRDAKISNDGRLVYVVTDDGVNVIDLRSPTAGGTPEIIPVVDEPGLDPSTVEILVSSSRGQSIARVEGENWLVVTDLASARQQRLTLPGYATDLEVSEDGSFALLTLPKVGGSSLVEIPLPIAGAGPGFVTHLVPGEYVGLASLSPDGTSVLLHTSQAAPVGSKGDRDARQRLTVARRNATTGRFDDQVTVFVEVTVRAIGMAPDNKSAVLLHESAPQLNPQAPWPYTLLDLTRRVPLKKLQMTQAAPGPVLFSPLGDRAAVMLRDDAARIRRLDLVSLGNFIVEGVNLASPPEGLGYVAATDKFYVAQEHPLGRITFIDAEGQVETVTGFKSGDAVKD